MSIIYIINGVDVSDLVYGRPKLLKRVGKTKGTYTNNLQLSIINENNSFSPESENSFLYDYRTDYSKIPMEISKDGVVIWEGVIDNIDRKEGTDVMTFTCVESIIKILSAPNFIYYLGDGYVGDRAYAGDGVTPAEHQLAILRRYLDDSNIDVGSFKVLKEIQNSNSINVSCEVISQSNKVAMTFLKELMMGMGYFKIEGNKISLVIYETFSGALGIQIKDDHIISVNNIKKDVQEDTYYSFAITYDNAGTPLEIEGSVGDNGTSTDCSATILTDSTREWSIDQWKDKYIFVGTGSTKEILKIEGNNKSQIYFSNCTKSGAQAYAIVENDKVYQKDYSDYPIKLSGGASSLGSFVVAKSPQSKLEVTLEVLDVVNIDIGDSLLLDFPDEGISSQSFEVVELSKYIEEEEISLICRDNSIYPVLEDYNILPPHKIIDLTGYRVESDGSAVLNWTAVSGASYYKVYYGVTGRTYTYTTPDNVNVSIVDYLERWLGYYFWVAAINFFGIEGELSEPIFLNKIPQATGYIDGTEGPLVEQFLDWGLLEDYHYLLSYKNVGYEDIGFLLKCPLDVLDRSQNTFIEEITQPFDDQGASQMWGTNFRRLGYIDGAGTSDYLPEFVDDAGTYKIKNSLDKKLTVNGTTYAAGATITGSEDWYLVDGNGNYYTYWFETSLMMDIANDDCNAWLKVWKIDQTMGIWESGDASIVNNETTKIGTLTDTGKSWNTDQWEDYYVGLVNSAPTLDIDWYKIISNTSNTITFDYGDDDYANKQYIINNEAYIGFHGLLMDDVWTSIYREDENMSDVDSGTAETVTATYLQDTDKTWITDNPPSGHWNGFYVSIDGNTPILITNSDDDTLYFSGNPTTGSNLPYEITTQFEIDKGYKYAVGVATFVELVVAHMEDRSYNLYRSWDKCEKGIFILNTWPDDFSYYDEFVAAVNKRFQHFVMFEALQMTWNMDNEVTKQYVILDWQGTVERWWQMKITEGVGSARQAILGYPYNQQMYLTHIAGGLIMTSYINGKIEDIIAAGNIVLDQFYYDTLMAGNKDNRQTIGLPSSGYEESYTQSQYDKYGIIYKRFEGCHLFYNPSRQYRTIEYLFPEDVVNYYTGEEFDLNTTYEFILPPRTPLFLFRNSDIGFDASQFLNQYEPYTYIDNNTAWVIFTTTGATAIGTDSVWIENGYTGNKRFILDGDQLIPTGTAENLFHSGDGADTGVTGKTPDSEALSGSGIGTSVQITSLTVLFVVKVVASGTQWQISDSGNGYAGAGWLEDSSKSWTTDEWTGYSALIDGNGPYLIDGNDDQNLWLHNGYSPEGNVSYEIGQTVVVSPTTLVPGTDYLIEQKEWDATITGKGKWKTYLYLLTNQTDLTLTTSYFEQGTDAEGWPQKFYGGEEVEHGVLYRQSSGFALKTGGVNQVDATTTLVEGTDYYLVPENVRHKWDFRIQPFGIFSTAMTFDAEIPLNMVYAVGGDSNKRGIHWGIIDPDNSILIKKSGSHNNSVNGGKATYTSKDVVRPKVLIYGFTATPRDDSLEPIAPASREVDIWSFGYQVAKYVGIYYDAVYVTGDWDGVVKTGASTGAWGSVQGMIDDPGESFSSWEDVADYFDVILINDTFLEYSTSSLGGFLQWASWMLPVDYNLIKNFKKRANQNNRDTILIDRRMGANAFVWHCHTPTYKHLCNTVQQSLLNTGWVHGSVPSHYKSKYWFQSDLTDVFGCLYYSGQSASDLSSSSANVYTKAKSGAFVKYSDKFTSDFRIGKKISGLTDHYSFDEEDDINHPILNIWENGGDWISYIPKTSDGREVIPESKQIRNKSNLYVKWLDLTDLESGEGNFEKYHQLGLNNIVLRREPLLVYHHWNFFNVVGYGGGHSWGTSSTYTAIVYPTPILSNYGVFRALFFSKISQGLDTFIKNKYIYFRESEVSETKNAFKFSSSYSRWRGYAGHYINDVNTAKHTYPLGGSKDDFGWAKSGEWTHGFQTFHGWWFPADSSPVDWGKVIKFDSWNDDAGANYYLSKLVNPQGVFPAYRDGTGEAPLEGTIQSISKGGDILTFEVDFDVSNIDVGTPITSGVILHGFSSPWSNKQWYLEANVDVSAYRNGAYYAHIETTDGTVVHQMLLPLQSHGGTWFRVYGDGKYSNRYDGLTIHVRESYRSYKIATFLTDSDNNLLFNARLLSKDVVNDTLSINCPRGVNQAGSGGILIAYTAEEDSDSPDDPDTIVIANKDFLGSRVVGIEDELGADIGETFRPEGDLNTSVSALLIPSELDEYNVFYKPYSMYHYEHVYKNYIEEFGYEKNTGLVSCQFFYAHQASNRPPVAIWPGMSEEDFHTVIAKQIGTKITFRNLSVGVGEEILFYYNSFNEMLKIKDTDVENPIDGDKKVDSLRDDDGTLEYSVVRNKVN